MATNSSLPNPSASSASSLVKDQSGANFTTANVARIIKVDDSTGCTLTNASIKGLTPAEFEALSNKEIDLARVIASSAEASILGVRQRGLVDLLNSSIQNIKPLINKVNVAEQSIILPYIQRRQRSVLNSGYFAVEAGTAATGSSPIDSNSGYSLGPSDWEVTVNLGASDWTTPIDHIERYFLTGGFVVCNWWDSGSGNEPIEVQFQIIGAVNATAGDISKAKVTLRPVGKQIKSSYASSAAWLGTTPVDATQAALAAQYQPTYGVVQTIANNVNDFEAWCKNQPTDLSVKLIVNWLQTTRESRTIDQSYRETLGKIMNGEVNSYLKSMVYTPLSEQNKIAAQASQDQWMRSTWFNQPINENQTPEKYMQLPAVTDPEDSSCTLEYKSNALGIKALLAESNRVKSKSGGVYTIEDLQSDIYYLKRNREQDGSNVSVVDVMTDRFTYNKLFEVFNKYYQGRYGWGLDRNAQINQQITHNGILLFNYSMFDLPEVGCQLAVFHDPYFDDMVNHGSMLFDGAGYAGNDGNKAVKSDGSRSTQNVFGDSSGDLSTQYAKVMRSMWFIDWSDVKIGIAGTNSVTRKWPKPEVMEAYKCRMAHKETEYSLRSTKWTTMMDVPARHLIVENFNVGAATSSWSTYIS